jgi:type VI secretion system FHA domain protein
MILTLQGIGTTTDAPFGGERTIEPGQVLQIGRALDNDWVLADPSCQVSKRHCAVSHEGGRFVVTDFSTNGVFFDDEAAPLGRGTTRPLTNGQTLQIGPYRFAVSINAQEPPEEPPETPSEAPLAIATPSPAAVSVSSILNGTALHQDTRAGASLGQPSADWLADVPAGAFAKAHASRPVGWNAPPGVAPDAINARATTGDAGQSATTSHSEHSAAVHAFVRLPESTQMLPSDWNEPPTTAASGGEGKVSPSRLSAHSADHAEAKQRLIAAFLDGAGLPEDALDAADQESAFREAGRMLRVAVEGTRKLLASASTLERELTTAANAVAATRHSPLESPKDAASALRTMIGQPSPGTITGSTAMSHGFAHITAHELALVAAIGEILAKVAAALDPVSVRARADAKRRPFFARSRKARYWNVFEARYQALGNGSLEKRSMAEVTTHLFAKAYAQQLRKS